MRRHFIYILYLYADNYDFDVTPLMYRQREFSASRTPLRLLIRPSIDFGFISRLHDIAAAVYTSSRYLRLRRERPPPSYERSSLEMAHRDLLPRARLSTDASIRFHAAELASRQ